jgi:hypothetical protein
MSKLKKMVIAGAIAGVAVVGGITVASSAGAETGSDLGCNYWHDANTFGVTCGADFAANATCNDGTTLYAQADGEWIKAGTQVYLYCAGHGGFRSGGALTK